MFWTKNISRKSVFYLRRKCFFRSFHSLVEDRNSKNKFVEAMEKVKGRSREDSIEAATIPEPSFEERINKVDFELSQLKAKTFKISKDLDDCTF